MGRRVNRRSLATGHRRSQCLDHAPRRSTLRIAPFISIGPDGAPFPFERRDLSIDPERRTKRSRGPDVLGPPRLGPDRGWSLPSFTTTTQLADWLGLTIGELDWFADVQGRNDRQLDRRLRHYTHVWVAKRGGRQRLLEVPKPRIKGIQRTILRAIVERIPPHPAAHGFVRGRSIRSFAEPHVDRRIVWRLDLKDFFPSVRASRVHATFCSAGYPPLIARYLTGLCTTRLPSDIRSPDPTANLDLYRNRHLPQGTPTSPALANLCAYRLDLRLASWVAASGSTYTRYADDLAFSGALRPEFRRGVLRIVFEEGFRPNAAKSRWMTPAGRQHLAGVVVNRHVNVGRAEFDELKAILTNCVRHGPANQNRGGVPDFRAHLLGRIAHVAMLNADRGRKLRELFERIGW